MLALIDYGAGNLTSVRKGFAAAGADLFTPAAPGDLQRARGIVVPGVGHFAAAGRLERDWTPSIRDAVRGGVPLLGICLGMQWLYEASDEAPGVCGLAHLAGTCRRLQGSSMLKVPHVGWNTLTPLGPSRLLEGVAPGAYVYFTHAFAAPVGAATVATSTHGAAFTAAAESGHVFGVQFHPEKSGPAGIRILQNFAGIADAR